MTQLSKDGFLMKWADRFLPNTVGAIDEMDLQEFADDISDSFVNIKDLEPAEPVGEASTTELGTVRYSQVQDPGGGPYVLSDSRVITGAILNVLLNILRTGKENTGVAAGLVEALKGGVSPTRDTLKKLSDAIDGIMSIERQVATYADLATLPNKQNGENVFVQNAYKDAPTAGAGDATVLTDNTWAIYKYLESSDTWLKLMEQESLDVDFSVFLQEDDLTEIYTQLTLLSDELAQTARLDDISSAIEELASITAPGQMATIDLAGTINKNARIDANNSFTLLLSNAALAAAQAKQLLLAVRFTSTGTYDINLPANSLADSQAGTSMLTFSPEIAGTTYLIGMYVGTLDGANAKYFWKTSGGFV